MLALLVQLLPYLKYIAPAIAIGTVLGYVLLSKRKARVIRVILGIVLLFAVVLAMFDFTSFMWTTGSYFNSYEFFHYYLGTKYAAETGYTDMYNAVLVADQEAGAMPQNRTIRDLDTHRHVGAEQVLRNKDTIKGLFTQDRWKEFAKDTAFFRKRVSQGLWERMLTDKGYNGTPFGTTVSGTLSNWVSTENLRGMTALATLDLVLLFVTLVFVAWAFGIRVALLTTVLFGSHYLISQHYTLRAAFLRLDWVMCLLMTVCALKKERYKLAGALTAYATLIRVFPLVFAFGLGVKALVDFIRTRTVNRRYFGYWASFTATAVILFGMSVWYTNGLGAWHEFLSKIGQHNTDISGWRVGFKYVFLMSYKGSDFWGQNLAQFFEEWKLVWWSIQAAVLLLSAFLVLKLEDYETFAFGYVVVFFMFAPTYYYHVMLIVPFIFFAAKMERPTRLIGVILMFATSMAAYKLYTMWDRGFALYFTVSCMLLAFVFYMMAIAFWARFAAPSPSEAPLEEPPAKRSGQRKHPRQNGPRARKSKGAKRHG